MLPEPNFPVKPDHFVGRTEHIEAFRQALQFGLTTGRTSSFAILGDWGIGKSSLLLKFATICTEPPFAMLPVFISASKDIHDYLRFAENLLDKFAEALITAPGIHTRLQLELQNWRFKRVSLGGLDLERESPRLFLSSGTSLLRHTLKEAWDRYLRAARLNGAIFFLDDLHNITSIAKGELALIIRDQFQFFGIENMNYSVCFTAKSDYFSDTKALAEPAVRFYTKLYLLPFTRQESLEYVRAVFPSCADSDSLSTWLHKKTLGHPYFLTFICRELSLGAPVQVQRLEQIWPAIFDQLGQEKFRSDISQLSAKEIGLARQFAKLGDGEFAVHQFTPKFQTEYFARLSEKGLLIRTGRGRYKLYHPLFREFLQQEI
jgi:AAA ATPase domain